MNINDNDVIEIDRSSYQTSSSNGFRRAYNLICIRFIVQRKLKNSSWGSPEVSMSRMQAQNASYRQGPDRQGPKDRQNV